ncbi:hypothetical protein CWE08_04440 [Aliidiomarina iranensis]|uniref:HTH luxR-type domain-containing protein n=1 Tax=Aliidiomarina iranensis TaxID=1434071 RepID=A0A432W0C0_9GAMM|nr:LuxR C-terminal-related transcriptional regulator [Aliidiomarina iranensis]RUO22432.1 hypothetical protein CWE08_04440 [Aliidiomarina iranensis]
MSDVIVALPKGIRHTGVVNELGVLRWRVHVAENRNSLEGMVSKRAANLLVLSEEFVGSATRGLIKKLHKLNPALRIMLWCDKLNHALDYKFNEPAVSGYLLNEASIDEVNHGCRVVSLGQSYTPTVLRQMAKRYQGPMVKHPLLSSLSRREQQIFQLISTGLTVSTISERLYISRKTVNTFRYRLYRKLNVENDVQITHLAYKYGLISHEINNNPIHQVYSSSANERSANDNVAKFTA